MSKTILAQVDGFTPLIDGVVLDVGLTGAAVFGKAWRFCQMSDGVCKAAQERIANELGLSRATVNTHIERLLDEGYLEDTTPDLVGLPHVYRDTGKAGVSISLTGRCQNSLQGGVKEFDTKIEVNKEKDISQVIVKANKTVDFILRSTLSPKAIQDAVKAHFKLTPNWEAKYNRQWMEWAVQNEVTPEQVECAANVWKMDKRFNWKMYDLKGIQEHWLELIESFTGNIAPRQPDTDGGYN